jgi:hypothetical protein
MSLNPMGGSRRPPAGAQAVLDDRGETIGWIALREPKSGGVFFGGWDVYKGFYGNRPWACFPTKGEAEQALRNLRRPTGNPEEEFELP